METNSVTNSDFLNKIYNSPEKEQMKEIRAFLNKKYPQLFLFIYKNNHKQNKILFFCILMLILYFVFQIADYSFSFFSYSIYVFFYIYTNRKNEINKTESLMDIYSVFFPKSSNSLFLSIIFIVLDTIFLKHTYISFYCFLFLSSIVSFFYSFNSNKFLFERVALKYIFFKKSFFFCFFLFSFSILIFYPLLNYSMNEYIKNNFISILTIPLLFYIIFILFNIFSFLFVLFFDYYPFLKKQNNN